MTRIIDRFKRPAAIAAACAMLTGPAFAQSALERLEALDERMNAAIFAALEAQLPALSGYLPSFEWDDQMRANGACLIERVDDAAGSAGVTQLLENYEETVELASSGSVNMGIQLSAPDGMSAEAFQAAYGECQMLEWLSARLADSGALAIIMESSQ